jgi:putative SOS response-associated peptidase YedK
MAFAGLWERWEVPEGDAIESCTIITTEANTLVAPVHARMPVILYPADHQLWLDPTVENRGALESVLLPYDPAAMRGYPVSTYVNSPRNEDPACIEPQAT